MVVFVLIAAGCAGAGDTGVEAGAASQTEAVEGAAPAVSLVRSDQLDTSELLDLSTGQASSLAEIATGDRALLLWFWSPSCVTCRNHALDIEAFAEEHADIVQVVGVGAFESVDAGHGFIDDTGLTTLPMLYEATGHLWQVAEVFSNSSLLLVGHDFDARSATFRFDDSGRRNVTDAAPLAPYAPQV